MYLLDTNVCIHLLNGRHPQILNHFKRHSPTDIIISSVVKAELFFGARNSSCVEANLELLNYFFKPLAYSTFDDKAAEEYGVIRTDLSRQGKLIGPNDLLIASIAKANDYILVSNNSKEFSRITGLRLVDWQQV